MKTIKGLPDGYQQPMEDAGKVVRVDYTTTCGDDGKIYDKYAYVYLPAGYDENKKYNILYCLHGGGGEIEAFLGNETGIQKESYEGNVKIALDHMIANHDIEPIIAVAPTYYTRTIDHSLDKIHDMVEEIENFCSTELIEYLMPAVEGKFSTYAESVDRAGLAASREHRVYTGFSMGALSTWQNYLTNMDCFKYFMPLSGDYWINGESDADEAAGILEDAAVNAKKNANLAKDDVFIFAMTGDEDIAYLRMKAMLDVLENKSEFYEFATDEKDGNFAFGVEPGAIHDYKYMPLYVYNGLIKCLK